MLCGGALQSHAFHLTITAVVGMALYQGVTALARNEVTIDFWAGVLIVTAVAILILPILSIPFIFGGLVAKPLARDRMNFRAKVLPQGLVSCIHAGWVHRCSIHSNK